MNKREILINGYLMGYMNKTAGDKQIVNGKSYPKPNIKGISLPKPGVEKKKGYTGPDSKPSTPAEGNDASTNANDILDGGLRKRINDYMKNKKKGSGMSKSAQDMELPGQGMGQMQAATNGFPLNAEMAANQQAAGGPDQQAMMEAEQRRMQQEQELEQLEQAKETTAHEAKKTQMAKDIYQNQIKIKKTQEDMVKAQAEAQNEEALSTMINNSSPGE